MNSPALVSLTFDDGLRCQFEQAVPILDQHGFSATFFLIANANSTHEQPNYGGR
jgi:peptidoglycan/xylan/chitin deacetylase (PgdA/CDA1 family)